MLDFIQSVGRRVNDCVAARLEQMYGTLLGLHHTEYKYYYCSAVVPHW